MFFRYFQDIRYKILTTALLLICCRSVFAQQSGRFIASMNDRWQFVTDSAQHPYGAINQLKGWQYVTLPHTWNATDVMSDEQSYYRGSAWYRRTFIVPGAASGRRFNLYFDGVNQESEVYVNGVKAGGHIGGYTRFCIDITNFLKREAGADNEIAVKVNNSYNENIPPLTADFTFYGGMYRNVYLLATTPLHLATNNYAGSGVQITTPVVNDHHADIEIKSQITNDNQNAERISISNSVYDSTGSLVASGTSNFKLNGSQNITATQKLSLVSNLHLWSPDAPYLYHLTTRVISTRTGKILDEVSNPLGLRWFKFDGKEGFFLNGKHLKLIGTSRHQDFKGLGNALPDELQVRDIQLLKNMGGNFLRIAHYPQDPLILETCDKLGIITSVEIPVVNGITESKDFTHNSEQMLLEMIRQNYNHPSLVIWAYMNEVTLKPKYNKGTAAQEQYFKNIAALASRLDSICRKEDPLRYTMISCQGDFDIYHRTGIIKIPMIIGWNLYQGWYGGTLDGFDKFLDHYHEQYPQKPVIITEYGADADERIHSLKPVMFDKSVEYALMYHRHYLKAIADRQFVAAAAAWNLADFGSEGRQETMPHVNNKGLLNWSRQPKDTYFLYQAKLLTAPFIKIGAAFWSDRADATEKAANSSIKQPITVYTNLKNVKLSINGVDLGPGKADDVSVTWQVPFTNGHNHLVATASVGNKVMVDEQEINFVVEHYKLLDTAYQDLNILLGANRYYIDELTHQVWQPDQAYKPGSWGYIGGTAYAEKNARQPLGSNKAIAGTENDPVYQTQQNGIEGYRLDVPDGSYEITLCFAELAGGKSKEALPYNLGAGVNSTPGKYIERVFDVYINDQPALLDFNIAAEYGFAKAVNKKIKVIATNHRGIQIVFKAKRGEPVLNALQVRKIW